jgi:hypothetical protein
MGDQDRVGDVTDVSPAGATTLGVPAEPRA